jgi:uncharacterized membrane protein
MTVDTETTATAPEPDPQPHSSTRWWSPWAYAVAAATLLFVVVYGWLVLELHAGYSTQAFDFGIYDQGLWLLSRFEEPFITLRGLHLLGDHASLIMIPLAPLFWVWDDPRALLLITVAASSRPLLRPPSPAGSCSTRP